MALPIRPRHDFSIEEIDALETRLYEFNVAATGYRDGEGLGFEVRGEDGALIGAIAGHTWGGMAEIKQLWVDDAYRGQGFGAGLLAAAIDEARRRGARAMTLSSHSFQAPAFYERHGFERIGQVDDYPAGYANVILVKRLVP